MELGSIGPSRISHPCARQSSTRRVWSDDPPVLNVWLCFPSCNLNTGYRTASKPRNITTLRIVLRPIITVNMDGARSRLRAAISRGLLLTAMALLILPLIANILLVVAGTFYVSNPNRPGSLLIGLDKLSTVSFNGIIPSNATHPSYLVTLSYFPNAFTWSWPSAPPVHNPGLIGSAPLVTSGMLSRGPTSTFDPFARIEIIPGTTGGLPDIPNEEYQCLKSHYYPPDRGMECSNPFWTAVLRNRMFRFTMPLAWLPFVLHLSAVVVMGLTWVAEWTIKRKKWWMRCQCPSLLKRFCPLPKGTQEEVEGMDEHAWDGVRVYLYWTAAAYTLLPAVHGLLMGAMFIAALRRFETDLPKGMGMDVQLGRGFLGLSWGGFGCAIMSALCVTGRWWLGKPRGWMEQQDLGVLDVAVGETPGEYMDGEQESDRRDASLN